jgi:hypothetical protein
LIGTVLAIHGQVVNQDAEGKSTIVFPGGLIGIDLGETALSFNFMNIHDGTEDKGFLWGVTASAENKLGIGKLIESGKVVPGGSFLVTFGYHKAHESYMDMARWENSSEQVRWENLKKEERKKRAIKEYLSIEIYNKKRFSEQLLSASTVISDTDRDKLRGLIEKYWLEKDLDKKLKDLKEKCDDNELKKVRDKIIDIINEVKPLFENIEANEKELIAITKERIEIEESVSYNRYVLFTRIGVSAGSFKSYTPEI